MEIIYSEKSIKILKNKELLEKALNVTISHRGKEFSLTGNAEDEFFARRVIEAINFGFPAQDALSIVEKDFAFEVLSIKDYTKRKDLNAVRSRIIGKEGKALTVLTHLTQCFIQLKDNQVGIIGDPEYMKIAQEALISIIRGAKHSNVYSYLEKHRPEPFLDLGLKETFKKKKQIKTDD